MTGPRPGYFGGKPRPPARYNPAVPAKKSAPKKTNTAPKGLPSTVGLTPQQWVAQALRAEMAPLEYTEQAREKRAREQQTQTQYATQAIMRELAAQQAPTAALFDNALAQQRGYATQYADMLKNANPDPQLQADLKAIGAPEAQQQQISQQNQANYTGQAAHLFNVGGVIPGNTLLGNRNAQVGWLAGLPAIEGLAGTQALGAQSRASAAAHDEYIANRMKIAAQGPGMIRQVEQDRLAQHNAIVKQLQLDEQIAQEARALGDKEAYQAAQIRLAQDRNALAQSRITNQTNQFDITSGQKDTALTISQQNANTAAAAAAEKAQHDRAMEQAGGLKTGKQRQHFFYSQRSKAFARARALAKRPTAADGSAIPDPTGKKWAPPKRQKVYNELWNTYYAPLAAAGFNRFAIRQMIDNALATANPAWKAPKRDNRPH